MVDYHIAGISSTSRSGNSMADGTEKVVDCPECHGEGKVPGDCNDGCIHDCDSLECPGTAEKTMIDCPDCDEGKITEIV